jgi:hypothetical protein
MFSGKSLSDRAIASVIALMFSATTCAMFLMQLELPEALMVINTVVVMGWFQQVRERSEKEADILPEPAVLEAED